MKRKFLLTCAAIAAMLVGTLNASAQYTEGVTVAEGTDYFLYNIVGQKFLTDGMDWGTHATIDNAGRVITIASTGDGTYSIYAKNFSNSEKAGYMTTNGYIDSGTNDANWVFTPVTLDGYTNVYTITNTKDDVTSNLWYNTADARVAVDAAPTTVNSKYWLLIPKSVRDAAGDVTYVLQNTDFNRPWERPIWVSTGTGGLDSNRNKEYYNTTFDVSQTVSSMALGKYKLTCQGFYRNGTTDDKNASLYINTTTSALKNIHEDAQSTIVYDNGSNWGTDAHIDGTGYFPDCQVGASMYFNKGLYNNEVTALVTDGTVKAGVSKSASVTNDWTVIDNFKLYYLGQTLNTGASTATTATTSATADTWYSLNIATAGEYRITSDVDATLTYESDGTLLPSEVTGSTQALTANTAITMNLEVGTIYFKTSAAGTVKILPNALEDGQDITDLFVSNPSFEDATGVSTTINSWTNSNSVMQTQGSNAFDNKQGTYFVEEWATNRSFGISQTLASMPAGYYVVSAYAAHNGGNFDTAPTLNVGGNSVNVLNLSDKYYVAAQLTETGDLSIGFSGKGANGGNWSMVDAFNVVYYTTLPDVTAVDGKMGATESENLSTAKGNYDSDKSFDNFNAFQNANMAAKLSAKNYATVADAYASAKAGLTAAEITYLDNEISETLNAYNDGTLTDFAAAVTTINAAKVKALKNASVAGEDITALISNPTIMQSGAQTAIPSGWEGTNSCWRWTQGTGNTVMECWNSTASDVAFDMHQTIEGIPNGYYIVSAEMQVSTNNEEGASFVGGECGVYATSGDNSAFQGVMIDKDEMRRYGVLIQVTDGTLTLGVKNASTSTARWFVCDNFTLTKVGSDFATIDNGSYKLKSGDVYLAYNTNSAEDTEASTFVTGTLYDVATTNNEITFTRNGVGSENIFFVSSSTTLTDGKSQVYVDGTNEGNKIDTKWVAVPVNDGFALINTGTGKTLVNVDGIVRAEITPVTNGIVWTTEGINTTLVNGDFEGAHAALANSGVSSDRAIYVPTGWNVTYTGNENDMTILSEGDAQYSDNISKFATLENGGSSTYRYRGKWGDNTNLTVNQPVKLEAGTYVLTCDALNTDAVANSSIFVDETSASVSESSSDWQTLSLTFTLTEAKIVNVGFNIKHTTNNSEQFIAFDNFVLAPASITRSTATDGFGTICAPFAISATGATLYSAEMGENNSVVLTEVTTPVAGTPYIYKATADAQTFAYTSGAVVSQPVEALPLVGVFEATPLLYGSNPYNYVLSNGEFHPVSGGSIPAYKAYLSCDYDATAQPAGAKALNIVFADDATAIKSVSNSVNNGAVYNLTGQRVAANAKGIVIVNGKKYLNK